MKITDKILEINNKWRRKYGNPKGGDKNAKNKNK